ncbi:hypothetical protein AB4Z38_24765, partial [Arthrobacter sp. 2RAF6]|uniref:hypothetical protein n=1 Tax=Arthrobacter sp. 2RAF6 TaxID=3233002 RepID=UPI003F901A19
MKASYNRVSRISKMMKSVLASFVNAGAFRRAVASVVAVALIVPLLVAFQTAMGASAANAGGSGGTVTSTDGRITATKTASTYSLPLGGGSVTYTYTVKNNTSANEYFVGASDDKCGTPSSSGLSGELFNPYAFIPAGATVTFTCTQTVTVTTTNTATFTFNTSCGLFGCFGTSSTVAPKATVDVQVPTYNCDTIWYGSLNNNGGGVGSLGTLLPTSTLVRDITAPGQPAFDSTAAIAINPLAPNYIYYTPRTTASSASSFSTALYRYDTVRGTETQVASGASLVAFQTNRLAFDEGGTLWSLANNGLIYSWTVAGGVSTGKTVTASNGVNFATLASGDIAFDGIGNMWALVADSSSGTTYLYTISAASLATSTPQAQLVGIMSAPTGSGATFYNGIAFDTNGNLYASANSGTVNNGNTWYLYTINKDTGATTQKTTGTGRGTLGDLASCALPKPQLTASKSVSPSGPAKVGDTLTYTIKVSNIGNLSATGATFQDAVPTGTNYLAGSTTLNNATVADSGGMPYTTTREIHGSTTANAGVIPAGDAATITFKVTVNASAGTSVSNQGSVKYVGGGGSPLLTDDPSKPGASDPTVTTIFRPAVAVAKTASPTTVNGSGSVTYTYAVTTGTGNEPIKNVVLSDDKCTVPATYTGDANSNNILDPGETWIFTCTQIISSTTTNTATVTGKGISTNVPVTSTAKATVTVIPPIINVAKTAGAVTGPDANGNFVANYTVTVSNTGSAAGTYGGLTDTPAFAPNLAVTGASWRTSGAGAPAGGSSPAPGPYALAPAGSVIGAGVTQTFNLAVTFRYTDTSQPAACAGPGTGLFNSVALPAGQEQGPTSDNTACATLTPHLVASKGVDPGAGTMVGPGQVLSYSLA